MRPNHAAQGENTALSKLSEAEYHTRLLLEEQKNHVFSEARSELNLQEERVESAGRALHESHLQLHFQCMGLHQANQLSDHPKKLKDWLCTELEKRERALQENRMKNLQETEELKKLCCTEAERAQQVRIYELSEREKEKVNRQ